MDRTYIIELHKDDRVGARYTAKLYRPGLAEPDSMRQPLYEVDDDLGAGIQRIFERLVSELIDHQDEHGGELP
jgi:hypothetical protein